MHLACHNAFRTADLSVTSLRLETNKQLLSPSRRPSFVNFPTVPIPMKTSDPPPSIFETRWTLIGDAQGPDAGSEKSKRAVEAVIRRYQPAILGAIRRHGINQSDCEDVCQEFLVKAFLSRTLPRADQKKGRFRTYLLHTLRQFLIDFHRASSAEKRGRGLVQSLEELKFGEESDALAIEEPRAEFEFEMDFAFCVHTRVLTELKHDYAARNQRATFEALSPYILEKEAKLDQRIAGPLEMTEAATRQALSRLRQRYAAGFQAQVAEIIDPGDDLKSEMKELMKLVLARCRMSGTAAGSVACHPEDFAS